jgi:hypothetical protein
MNLSSSINAYIAGLGVATVLTLTACRDSKSTLEITPQITSTQAPGLEHVLNQNELPYKSFLNIASHDHGIDPSNPDQAKVDTILHGLGKDGITAAINRGLISDYVALSTNPLSEETQNDIDNYNNLEQGIKERLTSEYGSNPIRRHVLYGIVEMEVQRAFEEVLIYIGDGARKKDVRNSLVNQFSGKFRVVD